MSLTYPIQERPSSAGAQGSCSNEPTGSAGSCLCPSRSSHGPRDPRPRDISLLKQRPDRAQGSRPQQAATGSEPAHTKAPSPGHRGPRVHQDAETSTARPELSPQRPPSSSGEGAMYKRKVYMVPTLQPCHPLARHLNPPPDRTASRGAHCKARPTIRSAPDQGEGNMHQSGNWAGQANCSRPSTTRQDVPRLSPIDCWI
ncbi:hypothetical protein CRENBAI_024897 [Crenichthys baileyi]|uniref:Uncharacterized protein n=1 Tax=Crenichthys baileyi TaxID=28760 RepID=A0AAV9R4E6_9TELE